MPYPKQVRMVFSGNLDIGLILEQLRYAGCLTYDADSEEGRLTLVVNPPRGVNIKRWASQTAERPKSFGVVTEIITNL